MDRIYIYKGFFYKGAKGDPLIKKAAGMYFAEQGRPWDAEKDEIIRPEGGKPRFRHLPAEFSVSHSGDLWMCVFSGGPCGLDVQKVQNCNFEGLSKRRFSENERRYVDMHGIGGFFDIWVRKEAFCKCTGMGIYSETPSFASERAGLLDQVRQGDAIYHIKDIPISDGIKCAVCGTAEMDPEMRPLQWI